MHDEDNDGSFPDESPVEVRSPRFEAEEQGGRERWPWLPGSIVDSAARTNGTCASRSASWPCCATGGARRAAPPAVASAIPAASATARAPAPARIQPRGRDAAGGEPVSGDRLIRSRRRPWSRVAAFAAVVSSSHIYGWAGHGQDRTAARCCR